MTRVGLARLVSVIAHPALLIPLAVIGAADARGATPGVRNVAAGAAIAAAVMVALYSLVQVRSGRWTHIDASQATERRQLNLFLCVVLFGMAGALALAGQPRPVSVALAVGGGIVIFALALRRRLKVSLHMAFAAYAAGLLWLQPGLVVGMALLALALAWSRLVLQRHTQAEVVVGAVAGCAAGLAFQCLVRA